MKRLAYGMALASVALAGCAHTQFAEPPEDKLVCPEEPGVPDAPVSDEENGKYLRDLRAAGAGCREDVNWLREWFRSLNS